MTIYNLANTVLALNILSVSSRREGSCAANIRHSLASLAITFRCRLHPCNMKSIWRVLIPYTPFPSRPLVRGAVSLFNLSWSAQCSAVTEASGLLFRAGKLMVSAGTCDKLVDLQ
jgi:hypothetical protein